MRVGRFFLLSTSALVVVIVLASGLKNYLRHMDRQRAERTIIAMRAMGQAVEAYAMENGRFPSPPGSVVTQWSGSRRSDNPWPPAAWPVRMSQRAAGLKKILSPRYVGDFPTRDAWGYPFLYATTPEGKNYAVVSTGRDGTLDAAHSFTRVPTGNLDQDLIYADGGLFTWLNR
jgi:type II secretory pathway pseudopilin PulG